MRFLAYLVRETFLRIRFFLVDRFFFVLWVSRLVTLAIIRAPGAVLRFVYFESMAFLTWLREASQNTLWFLRRVFAVDGLAFLGWQIRRAAAGLIKSPRVVSRWLIDETLGLVFGIFEAIRRGLRTSRRLLKSFLMTVFVAPVAWLFPILSENCCNAPLQHSRRRRYDHLWRWLLLGKYRCRYCGARVSRFWPRVDRRLRLIEQQAQSRRTTETSPTPPASQSLVSVQGDTVQGDSDSQSPPAASDQATG